VNKNQCSDWYKQIQTLEDIAFWYKLQHKNTLQPNYWFYIDV